MRNRTLWLTVVVAAGLILAAGAAGALPAAPDPDADLAAEINYQGRLTDAGGNPLDGTVNMRFQIWSMEAGGTQWWDSGLMAVDVDGGLFNVVLAVNPRNFNGQELWLAIQVNGEWLSPRQKLLAVPYALGLRPGVEVRGQPDPSGYVLRVQMDGDHATRAAVWGYTGTGDAVRGTAAGGYGLSGYTDDGYAVYGHDMGGNTARGYGGYFTSDNGVGVYGYSSASSYYTNAYKPGVYGRSAGGVGVYGRSEAGTAGRAAGVMGWGRGGSGGEFYSYSGNVIEGWEDVNLADDLNLQLRFKVTYQGNVYADGGFYSPAADLAEMLPAQEGLEPGDVLVIGADGQLARSQEAHSPAIMGVYSTKPGFVGGVAEDMGGSEMLAAQGAGPAAAGKKATVELAADGKVPLAIAGIVPVKASAENGAITPGSLLASSATPGHCMLAGPNPPAGTVLGKALQGLDHGTGIILMLIMLR
jgi:hypothetical protein